MRNRTTPMNPICKELKPKHNFLIRNPFFGIKIRDEQDLEKERQIQLAQREKQKQMAGNRATIISHPPTFPTYHKKK